MSSEIPIPNTTSGALPDFQPQQARPPRLTDLLEDLKLEIFAQMNCINIGTIQSFDATKQTAQVSINYLRVVGQQTVAYPQLLDCPVFVLGGGIGNLTFPIAAGDTCVVIFNDRDLDAWFASGGVSAPNSTRMHDISDGIAFVGIRSLLKSIVGYNILGAQFFHGNAQVFLQDATKALLQLGSNYVEVVPTGVQIKANATTLKSGIDALCNALLSWVDTSGDVPNPATVALINAAQALIDLVLI